MVRSKLEDGATVAPFLAKCYEMVNDPKTDGQICWCTDGTSFVISDVAGFQTKLLPFYFKHSNFSSFIRQLNIYGFRKIDTDKWIFANDGFIKGQKNLLKTIHRRKQSQVIVQQKNTSQQKENVGIISCEEEKKLNGLWSEVECLKADKNLLMQELAKLRQHQENSHGKLTLLRKQIKDMEKDQQQMLSFIVMAMQNPGFLVHILQPKEPSWRRAEPSKGVFNRVIDDDLEEKAPSGVGMIVRYQPPINQSPNKILGSEASDDEFNDIFAGIDFLPEPKDQDLFSSENCEPVVSDHSLSEPMDHDLISSENCDNRVIDDDLEENASSGEGMIVRYQPPINQSPSQLSPNKILGSDASDDEFDDIFAGIDLMSEPIDLDLFSSGNCEPVISDYSLSEPMNRDLFSSENCGPVTSDQCDELSALKQFLLSSPLREDRENDTFSSGEWEIEAQNSKMDSVVLGSELERDEKLEILTERMGNLASECNIKQ